jgi:hypothetical protein
MAPDKRMQGQECQDSRAVPLFETANLSPFAAGALSKPLI